jgi:hypothetical protein
MKRLSCPREGAVSKAARLGMWEESLAAHVADCPVCREVTQTSRWMQELAREEVEKSPLPDAGRLWQRVRWEQALSEKQADIERAHRAMGWIELALLAIAAVGLGAWGVWNAQGLESGLTWLEVGLTPRTWVYAYYAASSSSVVLWTAVGIASLAALFLTTRILAEE